METRTADIAVIGGGIIGMSCAYELVRQGAGRVALFDKSLPASGTTGGSAGVICLHDMGEIYALLTLVGYARVQELRKRHDFGFQPWGALQTVYEPGELPAAPDEYEIRFGGGSESIYARETLTRAEVLARYPWMGSDRLRGGVFYPNQGYLDPHALVDTYERLATETGRVEVHRNTPVLQMRKTGDRVTTLVTRKGAWSVGQVLNAGGPWGAKVAALAGTYLPLTPQRIQVCVATAFDDGLDRARAPLTGVPEPVDGAHVWCRGELGGTLLFGQHFHETQPGLTVDPDHVNRANDPGYPQQVEAVYRRYFRLPRSVFLNGWCCVYGTTADGFPIISRDPSVANLFHAVGMNGHGMTCHAGVALATANLMLHGQTRTALEHIVGKPETLDIAPLAATRFAHPGELLDFTLRSRAGPCGWPGF